MATHSIVLAWRIPLDRGAWRATVHGVAELDITGPLTTARHTHSSLTEGCFGGVSFLTPLADHFVPRGNL